MSVDDPGFGSPIEASVDEASGTWSAPLGVLADGPHALHVRARMDQTSSPVATSSFVVAADAHVEWQVVSRNGAPDPAAWKTADGIAAWSFSFDTGAYGPGQRTIVTRLIDGDLETARATVRARFR